ncbi:hypothetical protein DVS77_21700 [Mycolicibacterium moriokaense]|nr:hypothetical protein DVS77_21700 [Mycolicibacterium moriokaense]
MVRPRRTSKYDVLADGTLRVYLTGGLHALLDSQDAELTERCWGTNKQGYATRTDHASTPQYIRMHRVVMSRKLDRELAENELVDHISGNRLDNRRSNLRLATFAQNLHNRAVQKSSRHAYKGVSTMGRRHRNKCYRAVMYHDYQKLSIAVCDTPEEAAWMYDQWAIELQGDYARLNLEYV